MLAAKRAGTLLCGACASILLPALTGCAPGRAFSIAMVDPGSIQTVIVPGQPAGSPSASIASASTALLGALPAQRAAMPVTLITGSGATTMTVGTSIAGVGVAAAPVHMASAAVTSPKIVKKLVSTTVPALISTATKPVQTSVHASLPAKPGAMPLAAQRSLLASNTTATASMKTALGSVDTSISLAPPLAGPVKPATATVTKLGKGRGKPHG